MLPRALLVLLLLFTSCSHRNIKPALPGAAWSVDYVFKLECEDGHGSAIMLGREAALTANHVTSCAVRAGWTVIWKDEVLDLAIVRKAGFDSLPGAEFRAPVLGEPVICVGYPLDPFTGTSYLAVSYGNVATVHPGGRVRLTCPIYYGSSGGAAISAIDGMVVGVTTAIGAVIDIPFAGWVYASPPPEQLR